MVSSSMALEESASTPSRTLQDPTAAPLSRWQRIRPVLPRLLQAFLFYALTGMNDATLGILLPSIRAYYQLSEYYTVSLLFIFTSVGFFLGKVVCICQRGTKKKLNHTKFRATGLSNQLHLPMGI